MYIYIYMHVCMHACMHACVYVNQLCVYIYTYIHTYVVSCCSIKSHVWRDSGGLRRLHQTINFSINQTMQLKPIPKVAMHAYTHMYVTRVHYQAACTNKYVLSHTSPVVYACIHDWQRQTSQLQRDNYPDIILNLLSERCEPHCKTSEQVENTGP